MSPPQRISRPCQPPPQAPARPHQPPPHGTSPATPASTTRHQPGHTSLHHTAPARPHQPPPHGTSPATPTTTGQQPSHDSKASRGRGAATPASTTKQGNGQAITSRLHNVKPPPVTVAAQRSIGLASPALTAHQVRGTHPAQHPHIANAPKPRQQPAARVASCPTTPAGPLQAAHAIASSGQPSRRAMA